jgi:hypothetical protein
MRLSGVAASAVNFFPGRKSTNIQFGQVSLYLAIVRLVKYNQSLLTD